MAIKWFDLKSVGAKLERIQSKSGELCVRLTLQKAVSSVKMREVAKVGWIPSQDKKAGFEFSNFGKLSRLSELASMVSAFFPEDVILKNKTDITKLKQGEEIVGFDKASGLEMGIAPVAVVEKNIERLPEALRERIMARVNAAQKLLGAERSVTEALFRNDGINLWKQLSNHFGIREATKAMMGVLKTAQSKGEDLKIIHEALLRAAETGTSLPKITGEAELYAKKILSLMDRNREFIEEIAPGAWPETRFYQNFAGHFRVNYRVWDSAEIDYSHQSDEPEMPEGINFHADPALPTIWKKDIAFRISDAVKYVAHTLNVQPDDLLLSKNSKIVHLGNISSSRVKAYVRTNSYVNEEGQHRNAQAIKITPFSVGTFVHEFGHAIDFNIRNGFEEKASPDVVKAILDETGVRQEINAFLDVAFRKGSINEQYLAYLRYPDEMIARSFETAIQDNAEKEGDFLNLAGGGVVMNFPGITFMPTPPTAAKFLEAVKTTLKSTLENQLDAEVPENQAELSV